MKHKTMKQVAVVLFAVIVILVGLLIWASGSSGTDVASQAAATAQVPAGADEAALAAALADLPRDLNVHTVDALRARDDVLVLDVRRADEFASGHVPGALHLPVEQLAAAASQLPDDRTVILTCRTGRRSGQGVDILEDAGLTNVVHMDGGMVAWRRAGLDVEN